MANVPAGFTIAWPGSAAIPSGWARATALDDLFPKGANAGADPGTPGGADTHAHSGGTHGHTVSAHTHAGGTSGSSAGGGALGQSGGAGSVAHPIHEHSASTSGSVSASLATGGGTMGTSPNDPPYYTVRWITSNGTPTGIPNGAWTYWDAAALPASWSSPSAVRTKYLRGAAAGANGGGTGGSSSSHSHTGSAHTHPFATHAHTGANSGGPSVTFSYNAGSGPTTSGNAHVHAATFATTPTTAASGSATSASTGSTAATPATVILGIIQNDVGSASFPVGVIGLWLGLLSAIPLSLAACDGTGGTVDTRGKFIKGADVSAGNFVSIGTTSGAATHDHTDPASHTHDASHTHLVTLAGTASTTQQIASGVLNYGQATHAHASFQSGSGGGTSGSSAEAVSDAAHDPRHSTVIHVKYVGSIDVTITSPADGATITAPSGLALTWTLSAGTQSNKRVIIYASDQSTVVFDSGVIADATQSYTVPNTAGLRTGRTYYYQVIVTNNSSIPGGSNLQSFVTAWIPPSTLGGLTTTTIGGN